MQEADLEIEAPEVLPALQIIIQVQELDKKRTGQELGSFVREAAHFLVEPVHPEEIIRLLLVAQPRRVKQAASGVGLPVAPESFRLVHRERTQPGGFGLHQPPRLVEKAESTRAVVGYSQSTSEEDDELHIRRIAGVCFLKKGYRLQFLIRQIAGSPGILQSHPRRIAEGEEMGIDGVCPRIILCHIEINRLVAQERLVVGMVLQSPVEDRREKRQMGAAEGKEGERQRIGDRRVLRVLGKGFVIINRREVGRINLCIAVADEFSEDRTGRRGVGDVKPLVFGNRLAVIFLRGVEAGEAVAGVEIGGVAQQNPAVSALGDVGQPQSRGDIGEGEGGVEVGRIPFGALLVNTQSLGIVELPLHLLPRSQQIIDRKRIGHLPANCAEAEEQ